MKEPKSCELLTCGFFLMPRGVLLKRVEKCPILPLETLHTAPPAARPQVARRRSRTADARNLHQSPLAKGGLRQYAHRRCGEATTRQHGDLWRFRKSTYRWTKNEQQVDGHICPSTLIAALPWAATPRPSRRRGRPTGVSPLIRRGRPTGCDPLIRRNRPSGRNPSRGEAACNCTLVVAPRTAHRAGSSTVNTDPRPRALSTAMSPPCTSTMRCASARPSPLPSVACDRSAW